MTPGHHDPSADVHRIVRVALLVLPVFLLTAAPTLRPAGGLLDVTGQAIGRDFVNVWIGAKLALGGEVGALFDHPAYQRALGAAFGPNFRDGAWWAYPPHALDLFAGFGAMSYPAALALWSFGTLGLLLAAVLPKLERRGPAVAALVLSPAVVVNFAYGQNGALTGALIVGAIALIDRRPVLAGVLFGLLTIKPHLGLLAPFCLIAVGAWRTMAVAAVTALALALASVIWLGVEPWRLYLTTALELQRLVLTGKDGAFVIMSQTVFQSAKPFVGIDAAFALQAATAIVTAPLAVAAFRATSDPAVRALVFSTAAVLVLPYAFHYDTTAMEAATVWLLATRKVDGTTFALLLPAFVAPFVAPVLAALGAPLGPVALALAFAAAVRIAMTREHVAERPDGTAYRAA